MFNSNKTVLTFTKTKLNVSEVKLSAAPSVSKESSYDWSPETLSDVLSQVTSDLKAQKVSILLDESLTYDTELTIPKASKVDGSNIYIEVLNKIPEQFAEDEFAYALSGEAEDGQKVIVSVPVLSYFHTVVSVLTTSQLQVEAVSSKKIAQLQNENPVIGLALITDSKNLIKLLNSQPQKEKVIPPDVKNIPVPHVHKYHVYIAVFVVFIGLVMSILVIMYRSNNKAITRPIKLTAKPTPHSSPSPTPQAVPADYSIEILNGSVIKGAAAKAAEALQDAGFKTVTTGNASNSDFQDSVLRVKKKADSLLVLDKIQEILSDYKFNVENTLAEDSVYSLQIILGNNTYEK